MNRELDLSRREVIGLGSAALAAAALPDVLFAAVPGTTEGIGYFARFGVTEKLIRDALAAALARGGDYADLYFEHSYYASLALEDGEVNRGSRYVQLGVGVRVVKGDQTGYGFTEDLTPDSLLATAKTAAAIATGPARSAPLSLRVSKDVPNRYPVKRRWEDVKTEERLPVLASLNQKAFALDPRIKKVNLNFSDEGSVVLLADSEGRLIEDVRPMTGLYVGIVAEQDGRKETNGYNVSGRADLGYYSPDRLDRVVKEAVQRTTILFDAVQPAAGEMPVVLAAGSSGILLHEAIGHGMEADFNRKGTSIYADKIGKPIAKSFVNIVDEGTQEAARGALNVDDEGTPVGRTNLVEGGVLTTYLHDTISAKHYGVKPTGNGRRESYQYAPMPRMRSTYMLPGPHKTEEIIASVKKGIYCTSFTNGQVNIGPGDFTFYVKNGFLIEDGKLTRPIKDVNIIGNGPKVLEKVDMVSDDLKI
ncbi:MAG TPA: TldD/PmbA family protein, partial [Thermoanaerobaculia bacterium]|nr:TldD/PmbA family protein [Thermoanaerobaculia bacterium]